jgi:hypothetical protein
LIVVELTAAIDEIGTTQTFYLSDEAFTTGASDQPPHESFFPRLLDPGDITISIYRDGPLGGASTLEFGEIQFANVDGEFDAWKRYSFDGRPVVIRVGEPGAYPSTFTTVFVGTAASVNLSWDQVVVDLRDKAYIFSVPILTETYAGTNIGPNGLEGTNDDIGGSLKPMAIGGIIPEVAPPCVNTSLLIYQVNNGPVDGIPAVYIRGAPQTRGLNYSTSALMQAASVSAGTYVTCFAEGLFRLGGQDGQVTCSINEATRSAANMLQLLAQRAGLGPDEIDADDVAALDAKNSAPLGLYINDGTTYLDAMNQIAQTIGAWFAFDNFGVLRMGRLEQPTSQPIDVLHTYDIEEPIERTTLQNEPTPVWSVTIDHTKIYTVQTTGLVGSVTPDRLAFLSKEYRSVTVTKPAVQTQFKLAESLTVESLFTDQTSASTEAGRVLALHAQPYDVLSVPVDIERFTELANAGLWLGKELGVDLPRFGLAGGFSFIVRGISYQRKSKSIVLTLWGGDVPAAAVAVVVEAIGQADGVSNAYSAAILPIEGRASGFSNALGVAATIVAGAGQAIGNGQARSTTGAITGETGQPIGLLLILTKA